MPYNITMAEPIIYLRESPRDQTVRRLLPDYPRADLLEVQLYLLLLRIVHELVGRVERQLATGRLSRGRLAVLMILRSRAGNGMNAAALAHQCGVTRATMTGLLRGLDRSGLIHRVPHKSDRRMSQAHISPKGQQRLSKVLPGYYELLYSFTHPLGRKQLQLLNASLIRLLEHLTQEKLTRGTVARGVRKKKAGAKPLARQNCKMPTGIGLNKERIL